MSRQVYLVATAAGQGTRMASPLPKQFLTLGDKPILRVTIEKFLEAIPGIKVITVIPHDRIAYWKDYCQEQNFTIPQRIVEGGITRFHSVRNAIAHVPDDAIVAIHDGVRPLVSVNLLRDMVQRMSSCRALVPVTPSVDTLKAVEAIEDESGKTLRPIDGVTYDRRKVWGAQTPQMFLSEDLKAAYSLPYDPSFTDDASVVQAKGIPLSYCLGERFNLKITTPEDLLLAQAVIEKGL